MARKQPRLWRRKKEVSRGEEEVIGCRCPGGGGGARIKILPVEAGARIKARRREGARCSIQGELSAAGAGRDAG